MATSEVAHLRVKSRGFRFELEGREEFLSAEYPKLLDTLERAANLEVVTRAGELFAITESGRLTATDLDQEIRQLGTELDALSELEETEKLRLQMAMDRISKAMATLSNTLKKISDTAESIAQNLK